MLHVWPGGVLDGGLGAGASSLEPVGALDTTTKDGGAFTRDGVLQGVGDEGESERAGGGVGYEPALGVELVGVDVGDPLAGLERGSG